jgi:hypothetical protein
MDLTKARFFSWMSTAMGVDIDFFSLGSRVDIHRGSALSTSSKSAPIARLID